MENKKINYVLIFEGNGKGTKVIQNHLDGHSQIVMIPGTICSYFYLFYKENIKKNSKEILKSFHINFKSFFDISQNNGSDHIKSICKIK